MGNTHTWINSYIHMNNDITIHRVVYWIYYERVEGICEQVVKYFFILLLNIYNEFADFITAGKIFHNLGLDWLGHSGASLKMGRSGGEIHSLSQ